MSLPTATSQWPIIWAQLSRGGELHAQRQRFQGVGREAFHVNCVLVNESPGSVANFCRHWVEEFINGDHDLARQWRSERNINQSTRLSVESVGGIGAVGIFSILSLDKRSSVQLSFHPRLDGVFHMQGIRTGSIERLGRVKDQGPRDPRARPRTRRRLA